MSFRHQRATGAIFEQILVMIIALLMPLLISFVIYLVGSASGSPTPVGYGIQCLGNPSNGVCTILTTGTGTNVAFPTVAVNAINALIYIVAFLVAVIEGIRIAPRLMESRED